MVLQAGLWIMSTMARSTEVQELGYVISDIFLAVVALSAAVGFLLYGGRLFLMLQRFPIESRGRRKKLREVGLVTTICAGCFTFRWDACSSNWECMGSECMRLVSVGGWVVYVCV